MEDFLNDLFDILKINTIYSNDAKPFGSGNIKCLNHMLELGKKHGFITKNIDNYAGYIEYGNGDELIGILCHIDVVEVSNRWHSDPFNPIIKDNKIYARGVNDDKGPLMCSFYALKELKEEGFIPNKRIRLIMGCNEESGSKCIKRYKEVEEIPQMSFSPDADYPLIYSEKAILTTKIFGKINMDDTIIESFNAGLKFNIVPPKAIFKLKKDLKKEFLSYLKDNDINGEIIDDNYIVYGKSAHAMAPYKGINSIDLAFDFIKKYDYIYKSDNVTRYLSKYFLNDFYGEKLLKEKIENIDTGILTANLAILNISNNDFEMIINYRLPSDDLRNRIILEANNSFNILDNNKMNVIKKNNEVVLLESKLNKTKLSLKLEVLDFMPLHYISKESKLVKSLLKAYREVTNDYSEPLAIGGGTYAKEFPNAVAFGIKFPNEEDVAHIDDEYESIDSLYKAKEIIKKAIKELIELWEEEI